LPELIIRTHYQNSLPKFIARIYCQNSLSGFIVRIHYQDSLPEFIIRILSEFYLITYQTRFVGFTKLADLKPALVLINPKYFPRRYISHGYIFAM